MNLLCDKHRGHLGNSAEEDAIYSCRVYMMIIADSTDDSTIRHYIVNPLIYLDANILLYIFEH